MQTALRVEMGLFSFLTDILFGKASKCLQPDNIWLTEAAKWEGLRRDLAGRDAATAVILVAHFPDVLAKLGEIAAGYSGPTPVLVASAAELSEDMAPRLKLDENVTLDLIVGERHPMYSPDQKVVEFAEALPFTCRVNYHLSLDDPVMEVFANDWVRDILVRSGMTETESIESRMVTRRVIAAQKKIEARVKVLKSSESASDWYRLNVEADDEQE